MTNIIDIHQLVVKLQNHTILSDVSLSLNAGDILGLVGPSGCGKTTLLNTISGFIEQDSGRIVIEESMVIDPKHLIPSEKRHVGMIFQDYALFPHLTVIQNIGFGLVKLSKEEKLTRVNELLKLLKLEAYGNQYPHELSGGQQQRVAIARALAPQPKILLLDEPFSNIDARLRNELMIEIRQLLKSLNMTAIFVTHNKDEVFTFADKIAVMFQGEVLQFGTPIDVSQQPNCWQVADFLQLGSWIPVNIRENTLETALGNLEHNDVKILSVANKSNTNQCLLLKPKHLSIKPNGAVNAEINHVGITEQGFHYKLQAIGSEKSMSFNQLSFYSYDAFQLGQQLSLCIQSHHYLVFEQDKTICE